MLDFINGYKFDKKSLRVGLVSNNREVVTTVHQYITDNYNKSDIYKFETDVNIVLI